MYEKTPIDTISRYCNFLRVNPESCIICLLIDVVLGNRDDFQVRIYAKAPPNKVVLPAPSYVNLFGNNWRFIGVRWINSGSHTSTQFVLSKKWKNLKGKTEKS